VEVPAGKVFRWKSPDGNDAGAQRKAWHKKPPMRITGGISETARMYGYYTIT